MSARPNPRLRRVPVSVAGLRVQTARSEEQIARILDDVRAARRITLGEYWAAQRADDAHPHYIDWTRPPKAERTLHAAEVDVRDDVCGVNLAVEVDVERDPDTDRDRAFLGTAASVEQPVPADATAGERVTRLEQIPRVHVAELQRDQLRTVDDLGHVASSPSLAAGAPDTPRSAVRSVGEPTSAAVPLAAGTVGTPVGEGPIAPSPVEQIDAALAATARATGDVPPTPRTVGPYKHTPFYDGSCMILGPSNEQIATTKAPKAAFTVVDALNAAYHRGLAEGGTR